MEKPVSLWDMPMTMCAMSTGCSTCKKCIWITHDIQWIKSETASENKKTIDNLPTVETVLDENNDDAEIVPFDHGTPADANKTQVAVAINVVTMAMHKSHAK